jgi:hypothetical protein
MLWVYLCEDRGRGVRYVFGWLLGSGMMLMILDLDSKETEQDGSTWVDGAVWRGLYKTDCIVGVHRA